MAVNCVWVALRYLAVAAGIDVVDGRLRPGRQPSLVAALDSDRDQQSGFRDQVAAATHLTDSPPGYIDGSSVGDGPVPRVGRQPLGAPFCQIHRPSRRPNFNAAMASALSTAPRVMPFPYDRARFALSTLLMPPTVAHALSRVYLDSRVVREVERPTTPTRARDGRWEGRERRRRLSGSRDRLKAARIVGSKRRAATAVRSMAPDRRSFHTFNAVADVLALAEMEPDPTVLGGAGPRADATG